MTKWSRAEEPNQTVSEHIKIPLDFGLTTVYRLEFSLAYDTSNSFNSALGKDPERARRFGSAISAFTTSEGYCLQLQSDECDNARDWERKGT